MTSRVAPAGTDSGCTAPGSTPLGSRMARVIGTAETFLILAVVGSVPGGGWEHAAPKINMTTARATIRSTAPVSHPLLSLLFAQIALASVSPEWSMQDPCKGGTGHRTRAATTERARSCWYLLRRSVAESRRTSE